jgi:hypothetical protein
MTTEPELTPTDRAALDAAYTQLRKRKLWPWPAITRARVEAALRASTKVYEAEHEQAVADMMDRSGLLHLTMGPEGIDGAAVMAREIAVQLAFAAAQFLDEHPGAENYIEQDVWDEEKKTRYTVIFMRPGGKTPSALRREAEDKLAAVLALARSGRILLDVREVAQAAGEPVPCTCPGGTHGWHEDFDPDCPRHSTTEPGEAMMAALAPVIADAAGWEKGPHGQDGNIATAVLSRLCDPTQEPL